MNVSKNICGNNIYLYKYMINKIIWLLWLDFANKDDGVITSDLLFYLGRLYKIHPEYKIVYIYKWEYLQKLLNIVNNENGGEFDKNVLKTLKKVLDNKTVGGAHKSDFIRYFLLYYYGGFWIDASSFIVSSFNMYVNENINFVCYHTAKTDAIEWSFKTLGDLYDNIGSSVDREKWKKTYTESLGIKNKEPFNKYDFITENYFIGAEKNNIIIKNTLDKLYIFWEKTMDELNKLIGKASNDYMNKILCYRLNIDIHESIIKIMSVNSIDHSALGRRELSENLRMQIYNHLYDCGYLFNYYQLYISVCDYIENKKIIEPHIENYFQKLKDYRENSDFLKIILPENNSVFSYCTDAICSSYQYGDVLLIPSNYNRLGKWSYNVKQRISWEETIIGLILDTTKGYIDKNPHDRHSIINNTIGILSDIGFNQFKFGSFTRKSKIISLLKELFNDHNYVTLCLFYYNNIYRINNFNCLQQNKDESHTLHRVSSYVEGMDITTDDNLDYIVRSLSNSGSKKYLKSDVYNKYTKYKIKYINAQK